MKKYADLDTLLKGDPQAAGMFNKIPQYAKDQIMERGIFVGSLDELEAYIHKALRGDG